MLWCEWFLDWWMTTVPGGNYFSLQACLCFQTSFHFIQKRHTGMHACPPSAHHTHTHARAASTRMHTHAHTHTHTHTHTVLELVDLSLGCIISFLHHSALTGPPRDTQWLFGWVCVCVGHLKCVCVCVCVRISKLINVSNWTKIMFPVLLRCTVDLFHSSVLQWRE